MNVLPTNNGSESQSGTTPSFFKWVLGLPLTLFHAALRLFGALAVLVSPLVAVVIVLLLVALAIYFAADLLYPLDLEP